jgi:4-hydroxyacetophenone monooxygenase
MYLQAEFGDRPDLLEKVVPRTTRRGQAHSRSTTASGPAPSSATTSCWRPPPSPSITPTGIRTVDGVEHEVDVIIYGTGFRRRSSSPR